MIWSFVKGRRLGSVQRSLSKSIYSAAPMNCGNCVGVENACSTRISTLGGATEPRLVLINITPFAPRTPYIAEADASFSTENASISAGSMSLSERSTPSTSTSGEVLPEKDAIPRIQKFELS